MNKEKIRKQTITMTVEQFGTFLGINTFGARLENAIDIAHIYNLPHVEESTAYDAAAETFVHRMKDVFPTKESGSEALAVMKEVADQLAERHEKMKEEAKKKAQKLIDKAREILEQEQADA